MKPEGGKSRRHQERVPRILQMFGYLAVTFSLLLKKATHNNRKQHKATIDSNRKQHHNKFVRRQWSMGRPIALISQQNRHGLKMANLWPKIGQQRSLIGFILYLETWEQKYVSWALLSLMLSRIGGGRWVMGWQLSPDRYNPNCQEESWCLLHQKRDLYGVFYTIQSTFPII